MSGSAIWENRGSPPRGRGKAFAMILHIRAKGITPAWAGKSLLCLALPGFPRDHPRVGGEKSSLASMLWAVWGSPPRGRGKVSCTYTAICSKGITPAWAGKRSSSNVPGQVYWDHPRVGGEKLALSPLLDVLKGSPPRGRGKDHVAEVIAHGTGITPAWAGKSDTMRAMHRMQKDHPRVGGEKVFLIVMVSKTRGSPPRGRGKVAVPAWRSVSRRITPAWAGKRYRRPSLCNGMKDHPRVGGEKFYNFDFGYLVCGSPPRGRGKEKLSATRRPGPRITPAWAGKSLAFSSSASRS